MNSTRGERRRGPSYASPMATAQSPLTGDENDHLRSDSPKRGNDEETKDAVPLHPSSKPRPLTVFIPEPSLPGRMNSESEDEVTPSSTGLSAGSGRRSRGRRANSLDSSSHLMTEEKKNEVDHMKLQNRPPVWDSGKLAVLFFCISEAEVLTGIPPTGAGSLTMKFLGGRVRMSSSKNFLIEFEEPGGK